MQRTLLTLLAMLAVLGLTVAPAMAQNDNVEARPTVTVTDASINAGDVVSWSNDNVYILSGLVIVEDGAELHIEAGTVIKAEDGQSTAASALVVARGGKIYAMGQPNAPIIFTSVQDNISSADLLDYTSRGLWGGIVLLGHAVTNNAGDAAQDWKEIEGVNELVADGDTRAEYGGTDDNDSSGIMRFVSIRHTGINIGESDGNEIQGLTLGGVGRGTTLEYIESYASGDDGVEFFGGTVDLKYFISAFNSDDAVDWDQGWRGKGQFWFVLQGTDAAGAAAEQDGAGGNEDTTPFAQPTIYNVTYVGGGATNTPDGDRGEMLMFRDNTGGFYHNSIFTDYNSTSGGHALTIEDIDNTGSKPLDSRQRFEAGDLGLTHNLWWGFGAGNTPQEFVNPGLENQAAIIDYLVSNGNVVSDPMLRGIDRGTTPSGGLDPRPASNSPAFNSPLASYPADAFYTPVDFMGAFGRGNWAAGWSALAANGYFAASGDVEARPTVTVTDASINAGETVNWTADNVYVLSGLVIVEDGAELHIESGTVIKAEDGQSTAASALVIARGGKIFAEGTASAPIIFTSVQDNISSPDLLDYTSRGLWGGIVMLGHATTNNAGDAAQDWKEIEGVNELVADGDTRAEYGGTNDADNSGIMRYVSIRHTGINIGESDGNEIQGLTLGGVGSGTTLEYIESYASGDDGVEFFGGTVNLKYFVSAFNSDDAVDWDQGYRGKGQFWFVLQGTDAAGAAAEQDGAGGNEDTTPFASPTIYNATYIGGGANNTPDGDRGEMLMFRDNTGGFYHNSIFTDYNSTSGGHALTIEDIDNTGSKPLDSRQRFEAGDLGLTHNIWWGFGAGNTPQEFVNPGLENQAAIIDYLVANGNVVSDPMIAGVDRGTTPSGGLDPRPTGNSPAFTSARAGYPAGDGFFTEADYIGAFGRDNWLAGWTALDANGYLGNIAMGQTVDVEVLGGELPTQVELSQNFPNPFNPSTTIAFRLDMSQQVRLSVHDILGREIAVLVDGVQPAGNFQTQFDASNLASGMYIYRLQTATGIVAKTMTLLK